MAVFAEREINLRADDEQTKELKRIADRVRRIAIRDFGTPIALIVVAGPGDEPVVKLGTQVEEEVIEKPKAKPRKKKAVAK